MSQSREITSETPETPAVLAYVGEIRLLPFRHNKLPFGWYFCNGERFEFASPQGRVLIGLDEDFRADWNMETDVCSIGLPNLFSEDGRGCFLRPVDGVKRQVGVEEGDAIRNITGTIVPSNSSGFDSANGVFVGSKSTSWRTTIHSTDSTFSTATFDASLVVPTAEENRPLNLGMTPAIYLGV